MYSGRFNLILIVSLSILVFVCETSNPCPKGDLKSCQDGQCISVDLFCDENYDCDDGSDELGCSYQLDCENGILVGKECILNGRECDEDANCPDGSGEIDYIEINRCSIDPPVCSQKCQRTIQGKLFECSCQPGYTLNNKDNRTCVADGPEPLLFVTTSRDIRYISLPSKKSGLIQSGSFLAHGVAIDFKKGFVYWNEKNVEKPGIFKSMLDGTNYQHIVSTGVEAVEDLAIDWVADNIYFTDSGRKHIAVCKLDGSVCTILISMHLHKPRAVAVCPEASLLFWSDWGSHPHIGSAGMDGSEDAYLITSDIAWPNGLTVDETIGRIFWIDAKLKRIESCDFDGSNRKVLPVQSTHPYALDIFENTVYWCDPIENKVISIDKFTGKKRKVLMKEASLAQPTGIYIYHPSKQQALSNPCHQVNCSHLCLLSTNADGYSCACPMEMTLSNDSHTCEYSSAQQLSIVTANISNIFIWTHRQISKNSTVRLPTQNIENIGALAFNPFDQSIIYSDLNQSTIYSINLKTGRQTVLFKNAEMVEGLDVDPDTGSIYWTEVNRGTVVIGYFNGENERLVLSRGLYSPKLITLAPDLGLMFIVEESVNYLISVLYMDGSARRELLPVHGSVSAMAYDGEHLYFSDSLLGSIERVEIDGRNRQILRSHLGILVAIDTSSDSVFWITQFSTRINWFNKQKDEMVHGIVVNSFEDTSVQSLLMTVVERFKLNQDHVCHDHHNCSDVCVPTPNGAKCLCPVDKTLAEDKSECISLICEDDDFFQCQDTCIPDDYRCDGIVDCLGDEENCDNIATKLMCHSNQFQCHNGRCVPANFYCNGIVDCGDGSDEPASCPPYLCISEDEYACPNERLCIPRLAVCNGHEDCADKSDEFNCSTSDHLCSTMQFNCQKSRLCIPLTWVCDGNADCEHGEDEAETNCDIVGRMKPCPVNQVRCPPHYDCVLRKCNNIADCENGNDQDICNYLKDEDVVNKIENSKCSSQQFDCYLSPDECIPISSRCDCEFDCTFREDEEGCDNQSSSCTKYLFKCPNDKMYINMSSVCDGSPDCSDGADEKSSLCPTNSIQTLNDGASTDININPCNEEEFECKNGQCISLDKVCNGNRDCWDGSDEGNLCATSCENNGYCAQICLASPDGPICVCQKGYQWQNNGQLCNDIDECVDEQICSHYCNNTDGSYQCWCASGYTLEQDHYTCKATKRPTFVVATANRIVFLDGNYIVVKQKDIEVGETILGIASPIKESSGYLVTISGVYRINNQSLVYKLNGITPTGMIIEGITGNIYLSAVINDTINGKQSVIKVISLPLKMDVDIVTTQNKITDIAIDIERGFLFWSESIATQNGKIIRSTMDGQSKLLLSASIKNIVHPVSLVLDPIKSRIYWADRHLQSISSCDYDGHDQRIIVRQTNGVPAALTFFENRIFWGVQQKDIVYHQKINNNKTALSSSSMGSPVVHLLTLHPLLEPELPNPCNVTSCASGLCVLKNSSISFTCFCPTGFSTYAPLPSCPNRCPHQFFRCLPDLNCHQRSTFCKRGERCRRLTEKELCFRLEKSRKTSSLSSTSGISTQKKWSDKSNKVYARCEILDEVLADSSSLQLKSILLAILKGPAYVLGRLLPQTNDQNNYANQISEKNTTSPVLDTAYQTRFVENLYIADGNRLILCKIFSQLAFNEDNHLRSVSPMELRTSEKMGYEVVAVELTTWTQLEESEKINFLKEKLTI